MNNDSAISAQDVGKKYSLGVRSRSFRESLTCAMQFWRSDDTSATARELRADALHQQCHAAAKAP